MNLRLLVWVTSDCNLHCKFCSQTYTREVFKNYQMSMEEVITIVRSLKKRKIHINTIELTGGEPSLWENIEEGVKAFKTVCDTVTLVTNGNAPEKILNLNLKHWIVSASQATKIQMEYYSKHNKMGVIVYNRHLHKQLPTEVIKDSLPANCCVSQDCFNVPQESFLYISGKVYYCCNAFAISKEVGLNENIECDFEDDFVKKFSNKTFMESVCSYCICNRKVWSKI